MKKIQPYPGTRDFYPEDIKIRNWFFSRQRDVCRSYGYEEYSAPILEYTELYRSKSSEEIVNEQLYTFLDRGNREVSIRPEMTPTLARMVASRNQKYTLPLRWFSIANFMRYERPGKGRLREFYQLNVDLIGSSHIYADVEILSIAMDILKSFGAKENHFIVRFSNRKLLDLWMNLEDKEKLRKIGRIIDKKDKISQEQFEKELIEICTEKEIQQIHDFLNLKIVSFNEIQNLNIPNNKQEILDILNQIQDIYKNLSSMHQTFNLIFDPSIVRGFDYYTGLIFEIYDTHPENKRAIFGGGRYDHLIGLFGKESIPAIGFGMGDVTLEEFLRNHNLLPDFKHKSGYYFTCMDEVYYTEYLKIASLLRKNLIPVEMSLQRSKKFTKDFEIAEKKGYKLIIIMGESELKEKKIKIKNLITGKQLDLSIEKEEKLIENLQQFLHENI